MKIIIFNGGAPQIDFSDVDERAPIFAKANGILKGMVVAESGGWIVRTGGYSGATGHHATLRGCMESCRIFGWEFFVEARVDPLP